MKKGRRLLLMVAGVMIVYSTNLTWLNGSLPTNTSFGLTLTSFLSAASKGTIGVNLSLLDQIPLSSVLFVTGIIILTAAVLGSKAIGLIGIASVLLLMVVWSMSTGLNIFQLPTNLSNLGLGADLAIIAVIIGILSIFLPKLKLPSKSSSAS